MSIARIKEMAYSLVVMLLLPSLLVASPYVSLDTDSKKIPLKDHILILADSTGQLTPKYVLTDSARGLFSHNGYSPNAPTHWVLLHLSSCLQCPTEWHLWVYPMASFEVYKIIDSEPMLVARNGIYIKSSSSSFPENPRVARVSILPESNVVLLIKIDTSIPQEFKPHVDVELRPERTEMMNYIRGWILLSVIVGVMIALGFYVLYQYFLFRDRSFLYFFLSFLSFALYFLTYERVGYSIFGSDYITRFTSNYMAILCSFFYFGFSRHFLTTRKNYPKADYYLRIIQCLYIVPLALIVLINLRVFWNFSTYIHTFHILAFLALIIIAIRSFIDSKTQSGYYLLVNSIFFICLCIYIYYLYHRPAIEHTAPFILRASLKIGTLSQVVLFALAMAHRFRKLSLQVVEKQLDNERLEKDKIIEIQRIVSSKNEELEERVKERTFEINAQKEELVSQSEHLEIANREIVEQKKLIERAHSQITDSLFYAAIIQQAVLPKPSTMSICFPEHFYVYKPRDIVSGDFFWVAEMPSMTLVAVADCTGHGVPGAFMSMLGISLLNEIVKREGETRTDQILNLLRLHLINALQQESAGNEVRDGINISLCSFYQSEDDKLKNCYTLEFTGAHNSAIIALNREIGDPSELDDAEFVERSDNCSLYQLQADRMPISMHFKIEPFSRKAVKLYKGDMVYLFTDGVIDQIGGPAGRKFSSLRFRKLISECFPLHIYKQRQGIEEKIVSWMNHPDPKTGEPNDQIDDICILGIRIT